MSEAIQVQVDNQGDIVIPAEIRKRLGLMQGMTLVVEDGEESELRLRVQQASPHVMDEQGVLVVTSLPSPELEGRELSAPDLTGVVRQERDRRLAKLGVAE